MTNLDDRRQAPAAGPQSLPDGWHRTAPGPAHPGSGPIPAGRGPNPPQGSAPRGYAGQGYGSQGHAGQGYGGQGYGPAGWHGQGYPPAGFPQAPIPQQPSYGAPGHGMPGQGHLPGEPPRSNSWAMAALIVGIVCLAMSPLPILNQAGILVGFVGVGLSVPAIVIGLRHRVRAVMAFVALALSILGLVASFAFTAYFVSQIDAAFAPTTEASSGSYSPLASPEPVAPVTYTLEATSSRGQASVTWDNGEGGTDQESPAEMPWSRTVTIDPERQFGGPYFSVSTYYSGGDDSSSTVTCRLLADGQVVDEQTSRGMYATASCNTF